MVRPMAPTRLLLLLVLAGCAPATGVAPTAAPAPVPLPSAEASAPADPAPAPSAESIVDRGGELAALTSLEPTLRFEGDSLVVTGMTEVPGDSRLQAAYAMVDAITRSELAKSIAAHIVSLETDRSTGTGEQAIALYHAEATRALLQLLPQPTHGWQKVRQGDTVILRLFGRVRVPRADILEAVAATLTGRGGDPSKADAVVSALAVRP